jgi:hypothetical protein
VVGSVPDLIAWCFHSPRRLLAVAVAALALTVGAGVVVQALRDDPAPVGGSAGAPGIPADTAPALGAAVAFTRQWAAVPPGQTAAQWRARLTPLVMPGLAAGLAQTDPAALPGGVPEGKPTVRFFSVSSAMIQVPLSSGRSVLVTVVLSGGRWLVDDVQPLTGNAGDDPGATGSGRPPGASGG